MSYLDLLNDTNTPEIEDTVQDTPQQPAIEPTAEPRRREGSLLSMLNEGEQQAIADPFQDEQDNAIQYSTDVAQQLGYKGLASASRLVGMDDWGTYLEDKAAQQDNEIAAGGYKSSYEGSFTDQETMGDKIGWTLEGMMENSVSSGSMLVGGLAAAASAPFSVPLAVGLGAATAVGGGVLGAGEISTEMSDKGVEVNDAIAVGGGAVMGALEKVGLGKLFPMSTLLKKTGTEIIGEAMDKGGAEAAKVVAKEIGKRTGAETAVELAQEGTIVGATASVGGKYTMDELVDRAIDTAVLGAAMSGPFAVASTQSDAARLQTTEGQKGILKSQGKAAEGMEPATIEYLTETPDADIKSIAGVKVQPAGWASENVGTDTTPANEAAIAAPSSVEGDLGTVSPVSTPDVTTAPVSTSDSAVSQDTTTAEIPQVNYEAQASTIMQAGSVDEAIQSSQAIMQASTAARAAVSRKPSPEVSQWTGPKQGVLGKLATDDFMSQVSSKMGINPVDFQSQSPEARKSGVDMQIMDMLDMRAYGSTAPRSGAMNIGDAPRSGAEVLDVPAQAPQQRSSGAEVLTPEGATIAQGELQLQRDYKSSELGQDISPAQSPDQQAYTAPNAVSEVVVSPKGRERVYGDLESAGQAMNKKSASNPSRPFEIRRTANGEYVVRPKAIAKPKGGDSSVKSTAATTPGRKATEGSKRPAKKGRVFKSAKQKRKLTNEQLDVQRATEQTVQADAGKSQQDGASKSSRSGRPGKVPVQTKRGTKDVSKQDVKGTVAKPVSEPATIPASEAAKIKPERVQTTGNNQYSIARKPTKGTTKADVSMAIRSGFGDVVKKSKIEPRIVQSVEDIPGGPHPALMQGMVDSNGKIYMVADNIGSASEARSVFIHEAAGHNGVEAVERNMAQLVADVKNQAAKPGFVSRAWKKAVRKNPDLVAAADYTQLAKETIAIVTEQQPTNPLSKVMHGIARAGARSVGLSNPTQRYVSKLAVKALRAVQTGQIDSNGYSAYAGLNIPETMSKFKKAQYNWQDQFAVWKDTQNAVGNITDQSNAYGHLVGFSGAVADQNAKFTDKFVTPVMEALNKTGNTFEEMNLFLRARAAGEVNAHLRKVNPKLADSEAPSGMSEAEANMHLESHKNNAEFQKIGKIVDQMGEYHLDFLVANDLIAPIEASRMKAKYKHYIPLFSDQGDFLEVDAPTGGGFSAGGGKALKRRTGGGTVMEDVYSKFVEKIQGDISMAQKNKAWKSFHNLVTDNPNTDMWNIDPKTTKMEFNSKGNAVERNKLEVGKLDMVGRIGGERVVIRINRNNETMRKMAEGFNNLEPAQLGAFMGASRTFVQFFSRMATTLNPDFFLVNPVRDLGSAVINLKGGQLTKFKTARAIKNVPNAVAAMWRAERGKTGKSETAKKYDALVQEFKAGGGQTGWIDFTADTADVRKKLQNELKNMGRSGFNPIKMAKAAMQGMEHMNTALENGIRVETYRQAKEITGSPMEAIRIAKEVTVDFNKKGRKTQSANALYAFFNAGVQGTSMLVRNAKNPRFAGVIGAYMSVSAAMHALAMMTSPDEDEDGIPDYLQLSEHATGRAWTMYIGDTRVSIPQPWGAGFFNTLSRNMVDATLHSQGLRPSWDPAEAAMQTTVALWSNFSPVSESTFLQTATPTLLDPLAKVYENKEWHGGALRRKAKWGEDIPAYQAGKNVSQPYVKLSQAIHELFGGTENYQGNLPDSARELTSPEAFQMYVTSLTAGVGKTASNLMKVGEVAGGSRELELGFVPIARRFVAQDKLKTVVGGTYYKNREKVEELDKKYHGHKGNKEVQKEIKASDPELFGMIREYERVESKLKRFRKAKRTAKENNNPIGVEQAERKIVDAQSRLNRKFARSVHGVK